jgi:hypothetical protein
VYVLAGHLATIFRGQGLGKFHSAGIYKHSKFMTNI